jgi:hypothetical protein
LSNGTPADEGWKRGDEKKRNGPNVAAGTGSHGSDDEDDAESGASGTDSANGFAFSQEAGVAEWVA